MLKNYLKLAIKVLGRRKFFTFISLFGISFTLTILMVITSFLNTELGTNAPMTLKDNMLFLSQVSLQLMAPDTTRVIDSVKQDGLMLYDTTYTYGENSRSTSNSSPSYPFLDKYLRDIPHVQQYSFYSPGGIYDLFLNNNKLTLSGIHTDENFWDIFDFNFLEGQPYRKQQVDNAAQVAVITTKTRDGCFGKNQPAMGKKILLDGKNFTVIGVVETPRNYRDYVMADVYFPCTAMPKEMTYDDNYKGSFAAVFLGGSAESPELIRSEIDKKVSQVPLLKPEEYNRISVKSATDLEAYAKRVYYKEDPKDSIFILKWALIGLLSLFVLLPTLNLINLNISRIMERSAEIGVRKSFGATSQDILYQFIFENIVLTFIGGLIGFVFALILIHIINDSQILENSTLIFSYKIFFISLIICFFFGILSGVIPAYRMSKLAIVNALKQII
ncbi:MAG: putative ABC transport system permease protein [Polaribacter sp.]|jgi:putative ABC transport system permease protein